MAVRESIRSMCSPRPAPTFPRLLSIPQPGDVLAFRTSLWHAAFGGGTHRRMATFVYYDDPQTPKRKPR